MSQIVSSPSATKIAEEQDYAFAYGLYKDGLYQIAASQFDQFLRKYPSSLKRVDAFFLGIECRFQQEQFDSAAKLFAQFAREHPHSRLTDDALLRLGESNLHLRRPQEAITTLKMLLDRFGQSELAGEAAYWIGESYARIGDYENAIKYFTLSFENYPGNRLQDYAVYAIGWTYQTKQDYPRAVSWYQRLLKEYRSSELAPAAMVRVGECYYYMNDFRRAIQELNNVKGSITRQEERGEAEYLVGEAHYKLNEFEPARKQYEMFLKTYPGHKLEREVIYALGWACLKSNDFQQAVKTFDRLTTGSDPLAHAGMFRRGVAEKLGGMKEAAAATWNSVIEKSPQGEFADNALLESGLLLYEDGKYKEAGSLFGRLVYSYPGSDVLAEGHRMAGEALIAEGSYRSAEEAFSKSLIQANAAFDVKVAALYQLGWSQYKQKKFQEASRTFSQFALEYARHPRTLDARYWLGESYYQLGQYPQAVKEYQSLAGVSTFNKREEVLYGAAWSLYKMGEYTKALDFFEQLIAAFPKGKFVLDSRLRLADCHYFSKDYRKAEGSYRSIVRLFPDSGSTDYAYYQLAQTHIKLGNSDAAVEQFNALTRLFPASPLADDAQYAIGWVSFQNKDYPEAIKEFQGLVQQYPTSELVPKAKYSIGDAYYNQQRYSQAEKAYRDVVNSFPQSQYVLDAMSGIQYCLVAQGKQDEAVKVIDLFVKEHPEAGSAEALLLKKADLFYGQKQYPAAIKEYQSFANRYPSSPLAATAYYWIGKSYRSQNKLLDAVSAFERASALKGAPDKVVGEALLEASEIYVALKSYEKALASLSAIERSFSDSEVAPEAAFLKGGVFLENGDGQEAKNQYRFVVDRFPKSMAADRSQLALATMILEESNYKEARGLAERVAASRTDDIGAKAQYLVAQSFLREQDWQNAITSFLRIRYIFPAHEEWLAKSYLGLGEAFEQTNERLKAREAYQNVLKMDRQAPAVAEAQKRLKRLERL